MGGSVEISIKPHWVNGWFLKLLSRPCVIVGGLESAMSWKSSLILNLEVGEHQIAVGVRYRFTRPLLGQVPTVVRVDPGRRLALQARNGALNSDPFMIYATNASP